MSKLPYDVVDLPLSEILYQLANPRAADPRQDGYRLPGSGTSYRGMSIDPASDVREVVVFAGGDDWRNRDHLVAGGLHWRDKPTSEWGIVLPFQPPRWSTYAGSTGVILTSQRLGTREPILRQRLRLRMWRERPPSSQPQHQLAPPFPLGGQFAAYLACTSVGSPSPAYVCALYLPHVERLRVGLREHQLSAQASVNVRPVISGSHGAGNTLGYAPYFIQPGTGGGDDLSSQNVGPAIASISPATGLSPAASAYVDVTTQGLSCFVVTVEAVAAAVNILGTLDVSWKWRA